MDLDLIETLRSTGAVREFLPEPIEDAVLHRLLDTARFAPSGGNRQSWRVIVVKDPATRRSLRDLYLTGWYEYLAITRAGLVPWAPITDRDAEAEAATHADEFAQAAAAHVASGGAPGMAEALDTAPALLLLLADFARVGRRGSRPRRLPPRRGCVRLPVCLEPPVGGPGRGTGRRDHHHAAPASKPMSASSFQSPRATRWRHSSCWAAPSLPARRLRRQPVEKFTWVDRFEGRVFDGS